jgi:LysM repeat protein
MKSQTLPVKRRPAPKGIFKRLSAVTRNRKQRVAAAATADVEADDSGSKISRALTIIFLIHIVAIGLIFVHQRFLDDRPGGETVATVDHNPEKLADATPTPRRLDLPRLSTGDKPYIVRAGDNYARIAAAEGVDEADLRLINKHVDISPGLILKVPPMRILAVESPEVTALREPAPIDRDEGLVEVPVDVRDAPRAQLVRPTQHPASQAAAPGASGKTYVVKAGDSIWRIANNHKVNQDQLMRVNGITDARKVKVGMNLVIPQ